MGQAIRVSLFDSIADWMTVPLLHHDYANKAPARQGLNHPSIAPYGAYRYKGGAQIVLSIQNQREWQNFCVAVLQQAELVAHPQFADNVLRCEHRTALDKQIDQVFSQLDHTQLVARLEAGRIAYAHLNSVADLSRHPQLRRTTVETSSGPVELVAPAVISTSGDISLGSVPAVGEHNESIRARYADE